MNLLNQLKYYFEQKYLELVYLFYIKLRGLDLEVLKYNKYNMPIKDVIVEEERAFPGNPEFLENGWSKIMLMRYALAMRFCAGKKTLESCSGLGWGAFLLDGVCKNLNCIEIDRKAIDVSKKMWCYKRTEFIQTTALQLPFKDDSYDAVTAMESIEHFNFDEIKIYLKEINRVLKSGGILIGSSSFPDTIEKANAICSGNKYHLHICTKTELNDLLNDTGFNNIKIFKNNLFFKAFKAKE